MSFWFNIQRQAWCWFVLSWMNIRLARINEQTLPSPASDRIAKPKFVPQHYLAGWLHSQGTWMQ